MVFAKSDNHESYLLAIKKEAQAYTDNFDPLLFSDKHALDRLISGSEIDWSFLSQVPPRSPESKPIKSYLATPDGSPQILNPPPLCLKDLLTDSGSPTSTSSSTKVKLESTSKSYDGCDSDPDTDPTYEFKSYKPPKCHSQRVRKIEPKPVDNFIYEGRHTFSAITTIPKTQSLRSQDGIVVTLPAPSYTHSSVGKGGGAFMFLNLRKKGAWARRCK